MTSDEERIFNALLDDAIDLHRQLIAPSEQSGHTALYQDGMPEVRDIPCLTCGHINEAEYALASTRRYG